MGLLCAALLILTHAGTDPESLLPQKSPLLALIGGSFDLDEYDDSDFLPKRKPLAAEENGFGDLVRAGVLEDVDDLNADLKLLKDMGRGKIPWKRDRVAGILKERGDEFAALQLALTKPRIQLPLMQFLEDSQDEVFGMLRLMGLQQSKARFHIENGEWKECLDELERANWFAKQVVNSESCLIPFLVGIAGELAAMVELERALKHPEFPSALLPRVHQILRDEPNYAKAVTFCWKNEYLILRNSLDEHIGGILTLWFGLKEDDEEFDFGSRLRRHLEQLMLSVAYQPKRTRRHAVDCFSHYAELARTDRAERKNVICPAILKEIEGKKWRQMVGLNMVGHMFLAMILPQADKVQDRTDLIRAYRRGLQLMCALRQFEAREGSLPDDLALLQKDLGGALPSDPFSGKKFGYSPEKRLLWSVGENEKDEGGKVTPKAKGGPTFGHRDLRDEPTIQLSWKPGVGK